MSHRRNTELALLIMGAAITVVAYVLASLGRLAEIPANIVPFLAVILGLLLVAHLGCDAWRPIRSDPVAHRRTAQRHRLRVHRAASTRISPPSRRSGRCSASPVHWGPSLVVGHRLLQHYRYTLQSRRRRAAGDASDPGIGRKSTGRPSGSRVGPISFQPGEFAKIALAIFFAGYLVDDVSCSVFVATGARPAQYPDPTPRPDPRRLGVLVRGHVPSNGPRAAPRCCSSRCSRDVVGGRPATVSYLVAEPAPLRRRGVATLPTRSPTMQNRVSNLVGPVGGPIRRCLPDRAERSRTG